LRPIGVATALANDLPIINIKQPDSQTIVGGNNTMQESKTSTRVLLISAVILVIVMVTGPLGYQFELVPLMPSLMSVLVALLGGLLVALGAIVMMIIALKQGLAKDRNLLALALVIGLVPVLVLTPQIMASQGVPPIHNISTDTDNPPVFDAVVALRGDESNPLAYGSAELPAAELAVLQKAAYPKVVGIDSELSMSEAVARAETVLADQGLEIVSVNPEKGLVEATATTRWFGFKDDVVVRVTAAAAGTRIDMRSVSRVGQSDIGANAARIEKFLAAF
jgi:hypothetical protein